MAVHGDLLTPTLQQHQPRDWERMALPWQPRYEVYVGFLGGPVAVTLIAVLNGIRLRMERRALALMAVLGLLATIAGVAAATQIAGDTAPRLFVQLAGVLVTGPLYLLQRTPDRVHTTYSPNEDVDDDHASLWGPGAAACVAGWIVTGLLIAGIES